ncbi:MAG TPA: asparagine synthase (glutamine-hydrolyzing) [Acidimicrobiales bacterium]|nr:asparagine synthase (glutamine-hydrolyzing) [Acidimicrobiales bacterium]
MLQEQTGGHRRGDDPAPTRGDRLPGVVVHGPPKTAHLRPAVSAARPYPTRRGGRSTSNAYRGRFGPCPTVCGIAGLWDRRLPEADELDERVAAMAVTLAHRGPDDEGRFVDAAVGLGLGHRRLAIIDVSPSGHQPMESADGRYVVMTNGEIYNYVELRRRIGHQYRFRGHSDTEVLVAAISCWGLAEALEQSNGMFALAVWDRHRRSLHLARDRFGEKPLFYGWAGHSFLFASELKALHAHPDFAPSIDRQAVTLYLRHNCVPAPYCIYQGVAKLPPATSVTLRIDDAPGEMPEPEPYWSLRHVARQGIDTHDRRSERAWLDALEETLGASVRLRMRSDVPMGAFLSGGIDSSLVVALMQRQSAEPVHTFTMGFEAADLDEAAHAKAVAAHLGTDHTDMRVSASDALAIIPAIPSMFDEPFADSSQVPQALLARLTRGHVTVALSGDGGDELFAGYNRYRWAQQFWPRLAVLPLPARRVLARAIGVLPPHWWDQAMARSGRFFPPAWRTPMAGLKAQKVASVLPATEVGELHRILASHFDDPAAMVPGATEPPTIMSSDGPDLDGPLGRMLYLDTMTYLPDDILTKVDRATMAVNLETRVPFLDPSVAELAWRVPMDLKMHDGTGKWLPRRLLHRYVPAGLVERPKAGFGIPLAQWLRGPLKSWAEDLLDARRLRRFGYISAEPVRTMWQRHLSGRADLAYELWDVLMFQAWLEAWAR